MNGTMNTTEPMAVMTANTFPFWCGEKRAICCFMERRLRAPVSGMGNSQP
jgi:hypothetical protein